MQEGNFMRLTIGEVQPFDGSDLVATRLAGIAQEPVEGRTAYVGGQALENIDALERCRQMGDRQTAVCPLVATACIGLPT
jgi:hypothetical protein